jgi:transmembrane sensor
MTRAQENGRRGMLSRLRVWLRRRSSRTAAMGEIAAADCPRHDDTSNTAMNDEHVWDLIARYWAEQLGPGEEAALHAWAAESQQRGEMLRGAGRILDLSHDLGEADQTELAWERVRGRLRDERSASYGPGFSQPMFGGLPNVARRPRIASRRVPVVVWVSIAATLIFSTGIALRYWQAPGSPNAPVREWATHAGERVTVELQDGSRVMLGPDTRLRVASADFRQERTLRLQGIAHFAVAHDPSHPFTVLAGGSSAQAVGTAFAVRAYPEDATVHVVVSEGRVLFRSTVSRSAPSAMLGPGDAGRVSAVGAMSVERGVDLDESLGWMRGRLRYSMATAADVARDLDRWYGVTIVLDDLELAAIHVTTSFDPAWTAADAVQRFADVLDATIEARDDGIHLSRRPKGALGTPSQSSSSRSAEARP